MRHLKLTIGLLLLGGIAWGQSAEREVIASMGGSTSTSTIEVGHTAGQPVSGTVSSGSIVLTQGFEQEGSQGISLPEENLGDISVFPNPATRELELEINNYQSNSLSVEVINLAGQVTHQQQWNDVNSTVSRRIQVADLPSGEYLLKLANDDGVKKVISFIKK